MAKLARHLSLLPEIAGSNLRKCLDLFIFIYFYLFIYLFFACTFFFLEKIWSLKS